MVSLRRFQLSYLGFWPDFFVIGSGKENWGPADEVAAAAAAATLVVVALSAAAAMVVVVGPGGKERSKRDAGLRSRNKKHAHP